MQTRLVKTRRLAWRLLVPVAGLAVAAQLTLTGMASASHVQVAASHSLPHGSGIWKANFNKPNMLDCNSWGEHNGKDVKSLRPAMKGLCTDPIHIYSSGKTGRFVDNGWYVGHDEPSVKFISSLAGSGNTMDYGMRLPVDPKKAPTATGSVTTYAELSVAPWFGLPICDGNSYPQNPCTPLSDSNSGSISDPNAAGDAFMELQFYPPGFTPFMDSPSCSKTKWCAALTIDSLECTYGFATCNGACIEPVNFAFLQTNGVPAGPPSPQRASLKTFTPNAHTLEMKPGDVLKVSISNVPDSGSPDVGGLEARVADVTTHKTGYIVASAKNGFGNTNISDCSGQPFSFHAEYATAQQQNQVPWAALEGGVLMEQEVGHFESCSSLSSRMGFTAPGFSDPKVYQTCNGGLEGKHKKGEGPCNIPAFTKCKGAETQGLHGPVKCPTLNPQDPSAPHCEFADGFCMHRGKRLTKQHGHRAKESWAVTGCTQNFAQNGDLDYDGNTYRADWPNGTSHFPASVRYIGPFTGGQAYSSIQFETDAPGSEQLCNVVTGAGCTAPPLGAKFYPFWTLNTKQPLKGLAKAGVCVWNFGNVIRHITRTTFGRDKQYGAPDIARFGGTVTSPVMNNPELHTYCRQISL